MITLHYSQVQENETFSMQYCTPMYHDNVTVVTQYLASIVLQNGLNKVFVMSLLITALYQVPNIKGNMSVYPYILYISFTAHL